MEFISKENCALIVAIIIMFSPIVIYCIAELFLCILEGVFEIFFGKNKKNDPIWC